MKTDRWSLCGGTTSALPCGMVCMYVACSVWRTLNPLQYKEQSHHTLIDSVATKYASYFRLHGVCDVADSDRLRRAALGVLALDVESEVPAILHQCTEGKRMAQSRGNE